MRSNKRLDKKSKQTKIIVFALLVIWLIIILTVIFTNKNRTATNVSSTLENLDTFANITPEANELINIESLENVQEENTEVSNEEVVENKTTSTQNNTSNSKKSSLPYYIKVNYGAQVVTIYTQDENGEYTVPYKAMVCSTGVYTPKSGVYSIPARWEWLGLQGDVYGHYSTQIKGNILFHSVPYLTKWDSSSLEYWEYDKLGTYASAGCIRLTIADARWIFNNCANGTKVEFYSDSNPGPLGKPSAKKISSYPDYLRNWDPTDPDPDNPWHSYSESNNSSSDNEQKPEPTPEPTPTPEPEPEPTPTPTPSEDTNTDVPNPGDGGNTDTPSSSNNEVGNTDSNSELSNINSNTSNNSESSSNVDNLEGSL